jgi:uncharacterized protein (DUF1800 family)
MGTALSRKEKRKQEDPVAFGGDLEAVARAILDESEALKSRKTQVRENILHIRSQLLTAHSNGMSFDRMAQLLTERGLKCSAPTLREILGIPKKILVKKADGAPEKNDGGGRENARVISPEPPKNQTANLFGERESKAVAGQVADKIPAIKPRGDL